MYNFWKDKTVLITGGAGLIGSALAKDLVNCHSNVIIVDNLERGKLEYIEDILDSCKLIIGDLRDEKLCEETFTSEIDIVVHMASKVGGIGYYTSKPYEVISENSKMDSNVLSAVIANNIKKYFYASSAHVYPIELQGTPDSPTISESQAFPADPELSYGWGKLFSEKQIQYACYETQSLNVAIARYIGIYGRNQDFKLETGSVIPVFCNRAINYPQIPFDVWGTGQETRSYCYIDDAVEATKSMIEALDNKKIVGPYNVGKQERIKIEDIAKKIVAISEKDVKINYDTSKQTLIWGQWCDCTKIKEELGWEATTSFDDGLSIVYEDIKRRLKT